MTPEAIQRISSQLVEARQQARALVQFPGDLPTRLDLAYRIQDASLRRWPQSVAGWKVGYIAPAQQESGGDDRVTGPVFADRVWHYAGESIALSIIPGGFAAIEAEYAFVLGADADAERCHWTPEDAAALVASLHIGAELACSPLASINQLGPTAVVSDFGNNAGVILGPEISNWRALDLSSLHCECWIDDHCVGRGGAATIHGGLLGALAFALGRCARRGLPLKAGMLVTTGAATGIHDVRVGQRSELRFAGLGQMQCHFVPMRAERT